MKERMNRNILLEYGNRFVFLLLFLFSLTFTNNFSENKTGKPRFGILLNYVEIQKRLKVGIIFQ